MQVMVIWFHCLPRHNPSEELTNRPINELPKKCSGESPYYIRFACEMKINPLFLNSLNSFFFFFFFFLLLLLLLLLFIPWEFFTSALADGLSLEFEWQQATYVPQDSSQYSGWFQRCNCFGWSRLVFYLSTVPVPLPILWGSSQAHQLYLISPSPSFSIAIFVLWQGLRICLSFCFLSFSFSPQGDGKVFYFAGSLFFFFLLIITRSDLLPRFSPLHYYYYYYYYLLLSSFHIGVSWWFFTGVWVIPSLLKSSGLVSGFWPFSAMLLFGYSLPVHQLLSPPGLLIIL